MKREIIGNKKTSLRGVYDEAQSRCDASLLAITNLLFGEVLTELVKQVKEKQSRTAVNLTRLPRLRLAMTGSKDGKYKDMVCYGKFNENFK